MAYALKIEGIDMPIPSEVQESYESIWSSGTGRTALGYMTGSIIAEKCNYDVTWKMLTATQVKKIQNAVEGKKFFTLEITEVGQTKTRTCYRGPMRREQLGYIGDGTFWYKSVTMSFIER